MFTASERLRAYVVTGDGVDTVGVWGSNPQAPTIFVLTMTGGVEHVHSRWLDRAGFNLFVQAIADLMARTTRARMLRLEISQG